MKEEEGWELWGQPQGGGGETNETQIIYLLCKEFQKNGHKNPHQT